MACIPRYYMACYLSAGRLADVAAVQNDGHLFHLDFGYILGNDPKLLVLGPPTFRLTGEMVDVMGGKNGAAYNRFKVYCCQVCMLQYFEGCCIWSQRAIDTLLYFVYILM
jgi:phosphatidylinositol 3-kinase